MAKIRSLNGFTGFLRKINFLFLFNKELFTKVGFFDTLFGKREKKEWVSFYKKNGAPKETERITQPKSKRPVLHKHTPPRDTTGKYQSTKIPQTRGRRRV